MSNATAPTGHRLRSLVRELPIVLGLLTGAAVLAHWSPGGDPAGAAGIAWSAWLVVAITAAAFRAMGHADHVAEHLGEPLGTVVLTLSAITIEVAAVCAIMLGSDGDPDVARDTMFAVIMLILNLFLGIGLLIAGWRGAEREFNPQSSGAYLPLLITLSGITLVLPRFTTSTEGGWMSAPMEVFVGVSSLILYGAFLVMQTTRHRAFFAHEPARAEDRRAEAAGHHRPGMPLWGSIALLVLSLLAVVAMAEGLGGRTRALLEAWYLPLPLGGVLVALLVLAPEGMAALVAARRGEMQRCINVLLGSAVATIGLTAPAVIAIRFITGATPEFGLHPPFLVLLAISFFVSALTLVRGKVSALHGAIHVMLFLAWIATILDESSAP